MKRSVLLVGGDLGAVAALGQALAEAGFNVEASPDGFYAALVLERDRPAAVVVPSSLPDMSCKELGQILASDPDLAAVQRILLPLDPQQLPDAETAALFQLVLPAGEAPERIAFLVQGLLEPGRSPGGREASLSGTLDAVDFPQLIQLLAEARLGGVLRLDLAAGEGLVYFHRGEVIHCSWGDLEGIAAFREVLRSSLAAGSPFRYEKLTNTEAFRIPRTIGGPVPRLILSAAVDLDETGDPSVAASGRGGSSA